MRGSAATTAVEPARDWGSAPGLVLCALLGAAGAGLAATSVGERFGAAVLAMLLGILATPLLPARLTEAGASWAVRVVLPLGIVLLGARVRVDELLALGFRGVAAGLCVIALSGCIFFVIARLGRLDARMAALLAMGNGICGGSAIAAAAPVLGARRDEISASAAAVVIAGTVGTLLLPILGRALDLSPETFGLWAGLSLQQTPQVVAAGMALGPEAGQVATTVKLVRISLLAPVVFALGLWWHRSADGAGEGQGARKTTRWSHVPAFLWGFVLLSIASTLSLLPEVSIHFEPTSALADLGGRVDLRSVAGDVSGACLVVAMGAIGLQTRWETLRRVGGVAVASALAGGLIVMGMVGAWVVTTS